MANDLRLGAGMGRKSRQTDAGGVRHRDKAHPDPGHLPRHCSVELAPDQCLLISHLHPSLCGALSSILCVSILGITDPAAANKTKGQSCETFTLGREALYVVQESLSGAAHHAGWLASSLSLICTR